MEYKNIVYVKNLGLIACNVNEPNFIGKGLLLKDGAAPFIVDGVVHYTDDVIELLKKMFPYLVPDGYEVKIEEHPEHVSKW